MMVGTPPPKKKIWEVGFDSSPTNIYVILTGGRYQKSKADKWKLIFMTALNSAVMKILSIMNWTVGQNIVVFSVTPQQMFQSTEADMIILYWKLLTWIWKGYHKYSFQNDYL